MHPSMSLKHSPSASSQASSELSLFKQATGIKQDLASQPRRLSTPFSLRNAILGIVGLILATCFGVVTIVQTNTANREARLANQIAWNSMMLSGFQTCTQSPDLDVQNSDYCKSLVGNANFNFMSLWNGTMELSGFFEKRGLGLVRDRCSSPSRGNWTVYPRRDIMRWFAPLVVSGVVMLAVFQWVLFPGPLARKIWRALERDEVLVLVFICMSFCYLS